MREDVECDSAGLFDRCEVLGNGPVGVERDMFVK